MVNITAELITRIDKNIWIRSLMNGGCNLTTEHPRYDNQFKAVLISEEGTLNLLFTENHYDDNEKKFVDASVHFSSANQKIEIRVDNMSLKQLHFHISENKKKIESHTLLKYNNEPPLKFAIEQVLKIFNQRYSHLVKKWQTFNMPSLAFLSQMLTFTPKIKGLINFPVSLVFYPGSNITMQVYSKKTQTVRLVPAGFIIEKKIKSA
ncbi:hypothetical protein HZA96_00320 [Candidatus Woesearchaeota archaeon]|nr:hypothetical protein [Candidatus Woesearchaeota archaeon]